MGGGARWADLATDLRRTAHGQRSRGSARLRALRVAFGKVPSEASFYGAFRDPTADITRASNGRATG